jgi:predicted PurR-regulated permease PerM
VEIRVVRMSNDSSVSLAAPEHVLDGPEPPVKRQVMPLPQDLQSLLLIGILGLLVFYTLYFTSEIVLPIVFAFVLNLLLQPGMRWFGRLRVPKIVAALLMISVFFGSLSALGFVLSSPAADWLARAPTTLRLLEQRLLVFKKPVEDMQKASKQVERIAEDASAGASLVTIKGPGLSSFLFSGTRTLLVGLLTAVALLFFLLVSGDLFLRRLVEILPTLSDKKRAVDISREIESNISGYLVTISLMNAGVGVATAIAAYLCGLSDPILWGSLAFILNYIPILGPLFGVVVLFLAGVSTFDVLWQAMLPAAIYLAIHFVEAQTVTPMLLARRFTLNPVLVIVALVFWYWMWGIGGALLAVPMLATVKIVCDRITSLMALGHFIGAETRN